MNDHTLRVLEYNKIKNIVAGYAASQAGREAVAALFPATDEALVEARLRETREFTAILGINEAPPLDGIPDVREAVFKLRVSNSVLTPAELLNIASMLGAGRRVRHFFQRFEGQGASSRPVAPLLCARATKIVPLKQLEDEVFSSIALNAEVKDSASPVLRRIRKHIARMRDDILDRMSGILQDAGYQKVIQEPVITIRDDRYVLPLKPNFRQSLKGVVHGQSGSRATLFVEPLDILEQNNRLAELRMEEREEVERILRELSMLVSREAAGIEATTEALGGIDAVHARARFGVEYDGSVPILSPDGCIRLRSARHPLLVWKQKAAGGGHVAPNDIELDRGERALILSGPNAGGKTVILKITGILCLMAQSGMPVTAAEGSELPCFDSIFADIGDEQSLEHDLSTFSSHVGQISGILREAGRGSLVLLDELGSGTDPGEGAGLGAAVLESLIGRGCVTMATTHHNALKLFGSETNGARNAAMEFDPVTFRPTYRLIPGRPGRSYGLDMAMRLGVPEAVVQRARSRINEDDIRLETLLSQVEDEARALASDRERLDRELTAAMQERHEAENALRVARDEARTLTSRARTEAKEVLASLRQKLRELSRATSLEQTEAKQATTEVEALAVKLTPGEQPDVSGPRHDLHAGDRIKLTRVNKTGTVLRSLGGMVEIEVDGKKVRLASTGVTLIGHAPQESRAAVSPGWGADLYEEEGPPDRVNILGFRVEEGLAEVDRFIDRAGGTGLSFVTVIHGLGTGALKSAVNEFLKHHPLIASIRPGEPTEGGAGVTVAELKK